MLLTGIEREQWYVCIDGDRRHLKNACQIDKIRIMYTRLIYRVMATYT